MTKNDQNGDHNLKVVNNFLEAAADVQRYSLYHIDYHIYHIINKTCQQNFPSQKAFVVKSHKISSIYQIELNLTLIFVP